MELALLALPGTGFDDTFAMACFASLAQDHQIAIFSTTPDPDNLIASLEAEIARQLQHYDLIIAGLSISAAVAVNFTCKYQSKNNNQSVYLGKVKAIIAAAPAWTAHDATNNTLHKAPAQLSALSVAESIHTYGFGQTLMNMQSTTPLWLSDHMTRSWQFFGKKLATLCQQAAQYPGPTVDTLQSLTVPLVTIGLIDDPIHPSIVAEQWANYAHEGKYIATSLRDLSHQIGILGTLGAENLAEIFC